MDPTDYEKSMRNYHISRDASSEPHGSGKPTSKSLANIALFNELASPEFALDVRGSQTARSKDAKGKDQTYKHLSHGLDFTEPSSKGQAYNWTPFVLHRDPEDVPPQHSDLIVEESFKEMLLRWTSQRKARNLATEEDMFSRAREAWSRFDIGLTSSGQRPPLPQSIIARSHLLAEQFIRLLEGVLPAQGLRWGSEIHSVHRHAFTESLRKTLDRYLGTSGPVWSSMQAHLLQDVLACCTFHIAWHLSRHNPSDGPREISSKRNHHARFSLYDEIIGEGGEHCLEPATAIMAAFPSARKMDDDHQSQTHKNLEEAVKTSLAPVATLGSFQDLAYECHSIWYKFRTLHHMDIGIALPSSRRMARLGDLHHGRILVRSDWDPEPLISHLRDIGEKTSIRRLLTVTGSPLLPFATSCEEYVRRTWPGLGGEILKTLEDGLAKWVVIKDHKATVTHWNDSLRLGTVPVRLELETRPKLQFNFAIYEDQLCQVMQILAWMTAALRLPSRQDVPESVSVSVQEEDGRLHIRTTKKELEATIQNQMCWLRMLDQVVIADGFPIPERKEGKGLQVSLRTACDIIGASQAIECGGGPVIKGLAGLLIPMRSLEHHVQWHLVVHKNQERRMSLLKELKGHPNRMTRQTKDRGDIEAIEKSFSKPDNVCFIGWHPKAHSRAGFDPSDVDYLSIRKSGLKSPGHRFQLKNFTLGFQQFATAEVEMGAIPFQSTVYIRRKHHWLDDLLLQAAQERLLVYDAQAKRGWLLTSAEVVLHILQRQFLRHQNIAFSCKSSAAETLHTNAPMVIDGNLKVQDLITDKLDTLERLQAEVSNFEPGWRVHQRLFGFEFLACAERRSVFTLREACIEGTALGHSWVSLIHESDILVLFGSGFGEMIGIEDSEKAATCTLWRSVPCGSYLMTATAQVLKQLYDEEPEVDGGDKNRYLTSLKLEWDQGLSKLFEPCMEPHETFCCQRVQMLRTRGVFNSRRKIEGPKCIPTTGAVIFGDPEMVKATTAKKGKSLTLWKKALSIEDTKAGVSPAPIEPKGVLGGNDLVQVEEQLAQVTAQ